VPDWQDKIHRPLKLALVRVRCEIGGRSKLHGEVAARVAGTQQDNVVSEPASFGALGTSPLQMQIAKAKQQNCRSRA
jgi:hypothetical protein